MYQAIESTGIVAIGGEYSQSHSDDITYRFVAQLLPPEEASKVMNGFYTSALHAALVAQLARLRQRNEGANGSRLNPLPKWRLKRVQDFVVANLEERITLHTLAAVAGVSRMYFAAQFRQATGMRPHDYVLESRIAAARTMLADHRRPIVDIALSVGFQTQSHFTTVFKNRVGMTPNRFRQALGSGF